jgi:serine/threonine protein kinase
MSLTPGTRLGLYEITGAIGAGGMGEVYRGRDATLSREVAIKVLPATMASDAERLARFKREAQVLASLNHPNIAHVYGFEGATLPDGTTAHFLAMELVEGEDLQPRLRRGAIPVDEARSIARQIAEGLEAAHEKGIVHRDLKPANIKVTPDVAGDRANVWFLPLDGKPGRKVTSFTDQLLFDFALSDDGERLLVARGPRLRDAQLITGFDVGPS